MMYKDTYIANLHKYVDIKKVEQTLENYKKKKEEKPEKICPKCKGKGDWYDRQWLIYHDICPECGGTGVI